MCYRATGKHTVCWGYRGAPCLLEYWLRGITNTHWVQIPLWCNTVHHFHSTICTAWSSVYSDGQRGNIFLPRARISFCCTDLVLCWPLLCNTHWEHHRFVCLHPRLCCAVNSNTCTFGGICNLPPHNLHLRLWQRIEIPVLGTPGPSNPLTKPLPLPTLCHSPELRRFISATGQLTFDT